MKMTTVDVTGQITHNDAGKLYRRYGFDCFCPADISAALAAAGGGDVHVNINSPGGDVEAASEIYSRLISYDGNVYIHVMGLAASAASVIMCAGYSDISPVAKVMIHCSWARAQGNHKDMEKAAETLTVYDKSIASAYMQKTGMSFDKVIDLMENTTYLTAEDAVKLGLCDKIMQPKKLDKAKAELRQRLQNLKSKKGEMQNG